MKNVPFLLALLALCFYSCDPPNKAIFNTESVKLIGSISDTNEVIPIGSTIKLTIEVGDTIYSTAGKIQVESMQYTNFIMRITKVDTVNKRADFPNSSTIQITKGSISPSSSGNYLFDVITKPYRCIINFKPQEVGIYEFEIATQPGDIRINNNYQARLYIGFNTVNSHLHLVSPYFGGQAFIDGVNQGITEGFGYYVFRVN